MQEARIRHERETKKDQFAVVLEENDKKARNMAANGAGAVS